MNASIYTRTRAARKAAAALIRARLASVQAVRLVRALRKLNGIHVAGLLERGALVTVSQVLAGLGADADLIRRFASQAGKKIKAAFLGAYGSEPQQVWKVVNGRPRQVLAYVPGEPAIRAGLAAYDKTAHLVATPVAA
ncbi:hypothetical protein IU449_26890 [Nocardia higoensis]|uniref:Uncharacterized protein n=1 Tax=Nocardia higoensis TaxID=228599 RepID=A0ABS0DKP1_9NOCA|nr:hypothetical protein [Nocardia higoensis]MBF6358127.1 hypothetical protein [Nocardia higoensis]